MNKHKAAVIKIAEFVLTKMGINYETITKQYSETTTEGDVRTNILLTTSRTLLCELFGLKITIPPKPSQYLKQAQLTILTSKLVEPYLVTLFIRVLSVQYPERSTFRRDYNPKEGGEEDNGWPVFRLDVEEAAQDGGSVAKLIKLRNGRVGGGGSKSMQKQIVKLLNKIAVEFQISNSKQLVIPGNEFYYPITFVRTDKNKCTINNGKATRKLASPLATLVEKKKCKDGKTRNHYKIQEMGSTLYIKTGGKYVKAKPTK